jgi:quinoprotein glucose dehydrogenase
MGTNDARLIAVDADTGRACSGFGAAGQVHIDIGMALLWLESSRSRSFAVIGDVVVVGSAISDNARADAARVRARLRRAHRCAALGFDPVPNDRPSRGRTGPRAEPTATWSTMSVDAARSGVPADFQRVRTSSRERPGDNRYANSIVALRGSTGELVWHFLTGTTTSGTTTAAQPNLVEIQPNGEGAPVAAVLQPTRPGSLTLDRETGKPLYPVDERPVPTGAVHGEWLSPIQPFPQKPPPLVPQRITPDDAGLTFSIATRVGGKLHRIALTGCSAAERRRNHHPLPAVV